MDVPGRASGPATRITAVVFDLGGVLIDWDPRYLYRRLFRDEAAMETFLAEVCTAEWNAQQDAGRPWAEAVESLTRQFPDYGELIEAYHERWLETLGGPIEGSVAVLEELRRTPLELYALSNWSAEKFPLARSRFAFLDWFDGIVISGEVGVCKPDARIYRSLLERYGLRPPATLFVDDSPANLVAADELGLVALPYVSPSRLRQDLVALGLLRPPGRLRRGARPRA